MAKFDLASLMDTVSNLGTAPPELRMIPLEDIVPNEDNFYSLSDLGPLADSIAMDGLQQPLVVMPGADAKYLLISGHRRRAALETLVHDQEDPREDLRQVPCIVKDYASPAMAQLQLILANSTARVLTSAETMRQAEQLESLFYRLKEEGYEFPGRMRDQVAAACQVSAAKLGRLKVIRENLVFPYMKMYEQNLLPEGTAYALARLPEEMQQRIQRIANAEKFTTARVEHIVTLYESGERWEPCLECPDGKSCKHGDRFLRHDLDYIGNPCVGKRCCRDCGAGTRQDYPCEFRCSKAEAERKAVRDKENQREVKRELKRAEANQLQTQRNAQRLLPVLEAAGLKDNEKVAWQYSWDTITVEDVRDWASGFFDGATENWASRVELNPSDCLKAPELAKRLGCSTDFLLGLTDESKNVSNMDTIHPRWLPGHPEKTGRTVAKFMLHSGAEWVTLCWYDVDTDTYSQFRGERAFDVSGALGWWPVPEEDDGDA
jgi:ParB family chromosome partitioning protein